jgi:hypothetical protein
MVTVAGVAILIFVLIELPALRNFAQLRRGIHSEYTHAMHGHDVPLPIRSPMAAFISQRVCGRALG